MTISRIWTDPSCSDGNCPTVYVDDQSPDTLVIQGYQLDPSVTEQLGEIPADEGALRVPRELVIEAYKLLTAGQLPVVK